MKLIIQTLLIVLFNILFIGNGLSQDGHIGKWKYIEEGRAAFMNLDADNIAYLTDDSDTLGGRDFLIEGLRASLIYEVDYTVYPNTIDLIIVLIDTNQEVERLFGIFELISDDELKVCLNFSEAIRPDGFTEEYQSDTMSFLRVKE
ncbi:MAG TPA: hypothetical protein VFD77_06715 [Brumimicrobium sp.]|nr:hypothetical protein [Brumimicrobium sp.]